MIENRREHAGPYPTLTPSILADIPNLLRKMLIEASNQNKRGPILVSSNRLANRFIFERWGIRPSQRKRYKTLFSDLRRHCRILFQYLLKHERFEWKSGTQNHSFGAFKYDLIRGNLILSFRYLNPKNDWILRGGAS
jgi:hypothetical protein